jgi:hypothetical protein
MGDDAGRSIPCYSILLPQYGQTDVALPVEDEYSISVHCLK